MSKESRRASRNARQAGRQPSSGPSGASRAGRRERVRHIEYKEPFIKRYRNAIIAVAVIAVAAVTVGLIFVQSTQAAFSCSIQFNPSPTPSPEPGSSFRLGFAEDNMGGSHVVSRPQRYTFCPPASGNHYNQPGVLGPIVPRVYGPNDSVGPPNWVHNLEHGGLVILYRGDSEGATDAGQQQFKSFFDSFPPSPICQKAAGQLSPVIARFDSMAWPYAALVWDRVLPLPEWDPQLALQLYATESERLDADGAFVAPPEPQCAPPSPSAAPGGSAAPSASPSAVPSSAVPSASPSASQS